MVRVWVAGGACQRPRGSLIILSYLLTYLILSRFIEEAVNEAKSSGMVDKWIREFGVEGKLSTPE